MAHRCIFEEEIKIKYNKVVREVYGVYGVIRKLVFAEDENGKMKESSHLWYSYMGGYTLAIEGEGYYDYGRNNNKVPAAYFYETSKRPNVQIKKTECDRAAIAEKRPDLKYLIKKCKGQKTITNFQLFQLICVYKEHPQIEFLAQIGQPDIALDKRLFKMKPAKQKEIMLWLRDNPANYSYSLTTVLQAIKYKIDYYTASILNECNGDVDIAKYITKQHEKFDNITYSFYNDYISSCRLLNKNVNDEYWKYPNNLAEAHRKVTKLVTEIQEAKKAKETVEMFEKIKEMTNILPKKKIDGYTIFVGTSYQDWNYQAKILNQCIISAKYFEKMSKDQCYILFIRKGDVPIATAEIDKNKKIKQFYADERDRKNCLPNKEIRNVFDKYIKKLPRTLAA